MKNKYGINQTAGDNSVQFVINGNVVGDVNIFTQAPEKSDCVLEFYYKGSHREIEFDDETVKAFNAWYALPPENDYKVRVKESETGKIDVALSNAVKLFLTFMKSESYASGIVRNYLLSYDVQSDMYAHNYNFENDAQKNRFVQFAFTCVTIADMLKPRSIVPNPNDIALCGYIYKQGVLDFHFPIDIDKDILKKRCEDSEVLDYDKLVKVDCPDYYILDLGATSISRYVLPSYFLWLGGKDEKVIEQNPEILDLCNYKLATR